MLSESTVQLIGVQKVSGWDVWTRACWSPSRHVPLQRQGEFYLQFAWEICPKHEETK